MHLIDYPVTDRFGYYRIGQQKFYSKYLAIQEHARTGIHPEWHFNDEVFSSYNWKEEPAESLEELYRQRVEQLRNKYDYLVLLYSGGSDSHNILDVFINNNIKLDEICTYHNLSAPGQQDLGTNAEVLRAAFPYMEHVRSTHPEIRQRIVDITPNQVSYWLNDQYGQLWLENLSNNFHLGSIQSQIKYSLDPEYAQMRDRGIKIGFIVGTDKPRVWQIDGRWCVRFIDTFTDFIFHCQDDGTEFFYWSPDLPKLIIKQSHIVKRYLEQATESTPFVSTTKKIELACKEHNGKKLWLSDHGVHSLLYPTWNINTFSLGKDPHKAWVLEISGLEILYTKKIIKASKTTNADWCYKYGFKFAEKTIPPDWLI